MDTLRMMSPPSTKRKTSNKSQKTKSMSKHRKRHKIKKKRRNSMLKKPRTLIKSKLMKRLRHNMKLTMKSSSTNLKRQSVISILRRA